MPTLRVLLFLSGAGLRVRRDGPGVSGVVAILFWCIRFRVWIREGAERLYNWALSVLIQSLFVVAGEDVVVVAVHAVVLAFRALLPWPRAWTGFEA